MSSIPGNRFVLMHDIGEAPQNKTMFRDISLLHQGKIYNIYLEKNKYLPMSYASLNFISLWKLMFDEDR